MPEGAAAVTAEADSEAWVIDLQSGFGVGDSDVTINAAWYDWDNSAFNGSTAFVESGVRINKTMLTAKVSVQDPEVGDSIEDYTAGLHYFMRGHNARTGIEYRWGDSDSMVLAGVQFLL